MDKTENYLSLMMAILNTPRNRVSAKDFTKAHDINYKTWRRYVKEMKEKYLVEGEPIFCEVYDGDESFISINKSMLKHHYPTHLETAFYFEAYQKIGHLLDHKNLKEDIEYLKKDVFELNGRGEQLSRKFHYLSKTDSIDQSDNNQSVIVQALIENKQIKVRYNEKPYQLFPVCLTLYRGTLYLIAYKDAMIESNLRHFKLLRFNDVHLTNDIFSYPTAREWSPSTYFRNNSGIMSGNTHSCVVRVHAPSMQLILEKNFFESNILNRRKHFVDLELFYNSVAEFVGQLFVYAQDIEILEGDEIKTAFNQKAKLALKRNKSA